MIELKDICKSYYGQGIENKVLRHIDFKIEAGEFVMLYGESGSGKTTLLNIIGLLEPLYIRPGSSRWEGHYKPCRG